jgi:hypothetical protein
MNKAGCFQFQDSKSMLTAHSLADAQREAERSLEFAQKAGFALAIDLSRVHLALIRTLRGERGPNLSKPSTGHD